METGDKFSGFSARFAIVSYLVHGRMSDATVIVRYRQTSIGKSRFVFQSLFFDALFESRTRMNFRLDARGTILYVAILTNHTQYGGHSLNTSRTLHIQLKCTYTISTTSFLYVVKGMHHFFTLSKEDRPCFTKRMCHV